MINRSDYTDEEWQELLLRCKLLTEGTHNHEYGDFYDIGGILYCNPTIHDVTKDMVWLPRLDQLVRMDGWSRYWELQVGPSLSCIAEGADNAIIKLAPTPELAALRALQRCEEICKNVPEKYARSGITAVVHMGGPTECAGIHPPGDPHRCLSHALKVSDQ